MFKAKEQKEKVVQWIKDWFEKNGKGCNAVIGISGGKDSTVAAALCVEALGRDRVVGILMPQRTQSDINDSYFVCDILGIKHATINIGEICKHFYMEIALFGDDVLRILSDQARINLPPRVRMTVLYAISQSINGRVANTCNLSEDYVGYSTKYGDAAGDFAPLKSFTTDEVIAIGKELGLPEELLIKDPADGLCGKTDEENLGFSYAILNKYIRTGEIEDKEIKKKIDHLHEINSFKEKLIERYEMKD